MNTEILISFALAVAALAISPGPDNIYVLMQSLVNGVGYGMATVAGLMTGCLVHTTLIAFGVSLIIRENETLFLILKIFGALYLLYLAYKVYKEPPADLLSNSTVKKKSKWQLFKQGFIMNVINPKVSIFFLALFPGFLFSETINPILQFYVLGFIFIGVSFIIFSLIALSSGFISNYLHKNNKISAVLKWLQIIVFVGIALLILV